MLVRLTMPVVSMRSVRFEADTVVWTKKGMLGTEAVLSDISLDVPKGDRLFLIPQTYEVLLTADEVFSCLRDEGVS